MADQMVADVEAQEMEEEVVFLNDLFVSWSGPTVYRISSYYLNMICVMLHLLLKSELSLMLFHHLFKNKIGYRWIITCWMNFKGITGYCVLLQRNIRPLT